MQDKSRWVVYRCNVCNMQIALQLEDQNGSPIYTKEASTSILLEENHTPMIKFGIGKCKCSHFNELARTAGTNNINIISPTYTLIYHCTEDAIPYDVIKDNKKIRIHVRNKEVQ